MGANANRFKNREVMVSGVVHSVGSVIGARKDIEETELNR